MLNNLLLFCFLGGIWGEINGIDLIIEKGR